MDQGRLDVLAAELAAVYGADPQQVGARDGTEDDFGDLVLDAANLLGRRTMSDEDWQHFNDVAAECRSTTMLDWLATLDAIPE